MEKTGSYDPNQDPLFQNLQEALANLGTEAEEKAQEEKYDRTSIISDLDQTMIQNAIKAGSAKETDSDEVKIKAGSVVVLNDPDIFATMTDLINARLELLKKPDDESLKKDFDEKYEANQSFLNNAFKALPL